MEVYKTLAQILNLVKPRDNRIYLLGSMFFNENEKNKSQTLIQKAVHEVFRHYEIHIYGFEVIKSKAIAEEIEKMIKMTLTNEMASRRP
jgi:ribosomal protein L17